MAIKRGWSIRPRHIGGFMRPDLLTVLISSVALSKHGVDQFSQEVVVSAETSKIRLTAAFHNCMENWRFLQWNDQLWIHEIVGRGVGFSFRTIQLGAAPSMTSISGVYPDTSIFAASAPVLVLLPSSSPPSPSSPPSSSFCPVCTSSSSSSTSTTFFSSSSSSSPSTTFFSSSSCADAAAALLSSVTGHEASRSRSSGD